MVDLFIFFIFVSESYFIFTQELQRLLLECSVVKTRQNVGYAKTLGDAFCLFELLLVKGDIVVFSDVE